MISIIIPTQDNDLYLDKCLASIFEKTTYEPFEVVIIDNGSSQAETKTLFDRWKSLKGDRLRIMRMDMPFNYARLNNEGVLQSRGDLVCLLNDDTEVITPDWLEELAGQAQRKNVGAVSAFLLYPNSTIQHAGMILGVDGPAGHSHRYWSASWVGYFGRLLITANYAAVTGACLMVDKQRYLDVGGLDESLAIAYADVDFCLRLLKKGYRNVVLSHVRLFHDESRNFGSEIVPDNQIRHTREAQMLWERWEDMLITDPYYNPNLTRDGEDFSLVTDRTAVRSRLIRDFFPKSR
jgi:GT2 family glycosyltransferase